MSARGLCVSWLVRAVGVAGLGIMAAAPGAYAADDSVLAPYYGNSVICRDDATHAVCHLWLNPDHTYFLMYDRGVQPVPATPGGDFRVEGRDGTYRLEQRPDGEALCLAPNKVPGKVFRIEQAGEIYGGAACYPFAPHQVGDRWVVRDAHGRSVTLWLVTGH